MQTDISSVHLHESGLAVGTRARLKGVGIRGTETAGQADVFDSLTAPVSATYTQTGYVVTVTKSAHGLTTGDKVGIAFEPTGGSAANSGNFFITVTSDNTFTVTTLNSRTISGTVVCLYAGGWLTTIETAAGDIYNNFDIFPGEGMLAREGIYVYMSNLGSINIYYG